MLVVQVHDLLRTLREQCIDHTRLAKLLHSIYCQEDEWRDLLSSVDQLTELTWNSLNGIEPL